MGWRPVSIGAVLLVVRGLPTADGSPIEGALVRPVSTGAWGAPGASVPEPQEVRTGAEGSALRALELDLVAR